MASRRPAELVRALLARSAGRDDPSGDAELLARYVDGADREAFDQLYHRHAGLVHRVCRRGLGPDAAHNAFQAVWLIFARKAGTVRDGQALPRWLITVAYRVAVRARRGAVAAVAAGGDAVAAAPDPNADPVRTAAGRDLAAAIDRAVAELPDRLRVVFELCHLEGLGRLATIDRLGLKPVTFDRRLRQARDLLQAKLGKLGVTAPAVVTVATVGGAAGGPPPALTAATVAAAFAGRSGSLSGVGFSPAVVGLARAVLSGGRGKFLIMGAIGGLLVTMGSAGALAPGAPPEPPDTTEPPVVAAVPMTYQAELVRTFDAGLRSRLLDALRPLALGDGGRVELTEVDAQGPRLFLTLQVKHGRPYGFTTRLRFVRDTWTGDTCPMYDAWGTGDLADYLPHKLEGPLLLRPVWGKMETRLKGAMAAAIAVVSELPTDPRAVAEQARFFAAYKAAAAPLVGEWRTDGPKPEPVWLEWDEAQPMPLTATAVRKDGKGWVPFVVGWHVARIGPDGRPMDLGAYRRPNRVSADGTRIDFFNPDGTPAGSWTQPQVGE